MKKYFIFSTLSILLVTGSSFAQKNKTVDVPKAVKSAFSARYPQAKNVIWEKEKENYEANWGGKSGEDNSVQFTASGNFVEIVKAIPVNQLPKQALSYVKDHFKGAKITEAGKVTDAKGNLSYEAEVNKKDIIFDQNGKFLKSED